MFSTNVNLTPGLTLGCSEPGWFRVCYAREVRQGSFCLVSFAESKQHTAVPMPFCPLYKVYGDWVGGFVQ